MFLDRFFPDAADLLSAIDAVRWLRSVLMLKLGEQPCSVYKSLFIDVFMIALCLPTAEQLLRKNLDH